jgi:ribonuclease HII
LIRARFQIKTNVMIEVMAQTGAKPKPGPSRRPDLALSRRYGGGPVAGVDEAGRGPWAGPVVAAAVIFHKRPPAGINDSKQIAPEMRETLLPRILGCAHVGIGIVSVELIDEINIYHATHAAMKQALEKLTLTPSAVLIDGNRCPELDIPAEPLVKGDTLSVSVAAASIVAKVTRDRLMRELAPSFPAYAWHSNKGYGTREHARALAEHGATPHHRQSFRPVWERLRNSLTATG